MNNNANGAREQISSPLKEATGDGACKASAVSAMVEEERPVTESAQQGSQRSADPSQAGDLDGNQVLRLHAERATVSKKRVRKAVVRAVRTTRSRDEVIEENLEHVRVVIERVPIGQLVTAVPPVRQDGDVTIMPVVEEVVVVERRLFLKEEIHMRRVRTAERFTETVKLREQQVEVTRTDVDV